MASPKRPGVNDSQKGFRVFSKPSPPMRSFASSAWKTISAKSSGSTAPARTERFGSLPRRTCRRKGDRTYFKETIRLRPGEIYVSSLDLNQEGGILETPHVPTLRVATPVFSSDEEPFGIVIINIDMRPAFDRVRSSVRGGEQIYVVNRTGRLSRSSRSRARVRLAAGRIERLAERLSILGIIDRDGARCRAGRAR